MIQKNRCASKNIQDTFSLHVEDILMDKNLVCLLIETTGVSPTYPIELLFKRIFLSVQKGGGEITLNNLARRVLRNVVPESNKCEIISKKFRWVKRHWETVVAEILFLLGTRIDHAQLRVMSQKHKLDEWTDELGNIQVSEERNQQLRETNPMFFNWWCDIKGFEMILIDLKGKAMIKRLTEQVIKDLKGDLVIGWQTLIECCSLLQEQTDDDEDQIDHKNNAKSQKRLQK